MNGAEHIAKVLALPPRLRVATLGETPSPVATTTANSMRVHPIHKPLTRLEVVTTGIDEQLQFYGGDALSQPGSMGLRIPALDTATAAAGDSPPWAPGLSGALVGRYLFMLASFSLEHGASARLRGWRQYLTIGVDVGADGAHRVVEMPVTTPNWRFPDGNVSWHLMDMGDPNAQGLARPPTSTPPQPNLASFVFRNTTSPALLWESYTVPAADPFYVHLTAYKPPNQGQPYGIPLLDGGYSTIYDLRSGPWNSTQAWESLDVPLGGGRTIAAFASVRQTNPSSRIAITAPSPFFSGGIPPEEAFLLNFPGAIYWRIGVSLIIEV